MLPGYVMLGLTAVTVGTGTYFGIRALGAQSDFEDDPNDGDADDVEKFQMLSDLSFGAALTFGVTALVYMTYQPATETKPATARATPRFDLTPVASPRLAGATATLKF